VAGYLLRKTFGFWLASTHRTEYTRPSSSFNRLNLLPHPIPQQADPSIYSPLPHHCSKSGSYCTGNSWLHPTSTFFTQIFHVLGLMIVICAQYLPSPVQPCSSPNTNEFPGFRSAPHETPNGPLPQRSQKKVAAVARLRRGRRTVKRWGKCIVSFGLSVGMLKVLEVRRED
jgi:hypothetical protein